MAKTYEDLASRWFADRSLSEAESKVLKSAIDRQTLARDVGETYSGSATFGNRLADAIARVGGSWAFIVGFLAFLAVWTLSNVWLLGRDSFDPYPFIFLNLLLSMLAALQAPVIMMSQNRQAARDRLDAAHDYEVNLKAEIEIMALHEKMDMLRHREIVAMHADVTSLLSRLDRLEASLLSAGKTQPPAAG
ncbi:DUF1003 domain-containing protein [Mesorhizobium sp. CAU 1732]|uniref:DUF1003 domain-containing protein n=1 Tax=Mesorhizobium sp. CAU 1732 TaxID=3140358 RepID=UPI003260A89A